MSRRQSAFASSTCKTIPTTNTDRGGEKTENERHAVVEEDLLQTVSSKHPVWRQWATLSIPTHKPQVHTRCKCSWHWRRVDAAKPQTTNQSNSNHLFRSFCADFCGVQTPESSPHGSPFSATGHEASMRSTSGGRLTMDSFQSQSQQNQQSIQQGLQAAYESSLASHQLHQQNSSEDGSLEHKFIKSSGGGGDPARSLPTPEMSPVEASDKELYHQHQHQQQLRFGAFSPNSLQNHSTGRQSSFGENPVSQLISRFSDTSSFLRNVCPPFRVRGPPPSIHDIHYQSMSMDQVPNMHSNSKANYEYQVPAHLVQQTQHELHWTSHPMSQHNNVHYSPVAVDQTCLYTYGKQELKSSNESLYHESPDSQPSQQQLVYSDQSQYMSSGEHQAASNNGHDLEHGPYDGHANLMAIQHVSSNQTDQGEYERIISQQQHLQHQHQLHQQQQLEQMGANVHVQQAHQQAPQLHFSHLAAKLTEFRPQASSAGLVAASNSCDSEGSQEHLATVRAEARKIISN